MSDGATPGKGLHPSPARRCARLGAGDLAVSKPDLSAVQEHPVQGADGLEDSREVDWRSGEVDPVSYSAQRMHAWPGCKVCFHNSPPHTHPRKTGGSRQDHDICLCLNEI